MSVCSECDSAGVWAAGLSGVGLLFGERDLAKCTCRLFIPALIKEPHCREWILVWSRVTSGVALPLNAWVVLLLVTSLPYAISAGWAGGQGGRVAGCKGAAI